jgi:hypothetical protein
MSDEQAKLQEWARLLSGVGPEAARLEAIGQDLIQAARLSREVAAPMREILTHLPASTLHSGQVDLGLESWRAWHAAARQAQELHPLVNSFVVATSGAINTTMGEVICAVPVSPPPPPSVQAARTQLFRNVERAPLVDDAMASMRRLGLDRRGGTSQTPLTLLEQAKAALDMPVGQGGGGVAVLITLRECINATLAELLRRRPAQEPTPKPQDKVMSLGRHCARSCLPPGHVDRVAADAAPLMAQLSGGKQNEIPRDRQVELFHWGVSFLNALMNGIDESKLRA